MVGTAPSATEDEAEGPQKCPIGHGGPIGPLSPLEKLEGGAWSALNF